MFVLNLNLSNTSPQSSAVPTTPPVEEEQAASYRPWLQYRTSLDSLLTAWPISWERSTATPDGQCSCTKTIFYFALTWSIHTRTYTATGLTLIHAGRSEPLVEGMLHLYCRRSCCKLVLCLYICVVPVTSNVTPAEPCSFASWLFMAVGLTVC